MVSVNSVVFILFLLQVKNGFCENLEDFQNNFKRDSSSTMNYQRRLDNSVDFAGVNLNIIEDFGEFDFIVVGAGSAGAIVAKRLSENKFNTLLIEAGKPENNFTEIPGVFQLLEQTDYNWGYMTEPQKHYCQGMNNKQCSYPRGKSLGGSSTINAMFYCRGNSLDQDKWSEHGITGWSWEDVLPYYKKLEGYKPGLDKKYHGFNGPVTIDVVEFETKLAKTFFEANLEFGQTTDDYNGENHLGAGKVHFLRNRGRRISTGKAYLSNTNKYLTVLTEALAYEVVLNHQNEASGVRFVRKLKVHEARAAKEVILSGGSINTPQLLMLSGIGPKKHLEEHEIPVKLDLPVGENMQDHVLFVGLTVETKVPVTKQNVFEKNTGDYVLERGDLTASLVEGVLFISTNKTSKIPDIEFVILPRTTSSPVMHNAFNLRSDIFTELFLTKSPPSQTFTPTVVLLHPKSRGTVRLRSKHPWDFVKIDPNQLSDAKDIGTIFDGIKHIVTLIEHSKSFRKLGAKMVKQVIPDCKGFDYNSEKFWHCMIRHVSHTMYHPISTCQMGVDVRNSVVDSELKVHGTRKLRIVDASVIPEMPSGHTHGMAMMIGEKAADMIRMEHGR